MSGNPSFEERIYSGLFAAAVAGLFMWFFVSIADPGPHHPEAHSVLTDLALFVTAGAFLMGFADGEGFSSDYSSDDTSDSSDTSSEEQESEYDDIDFDSEMDVDVISSDDRDGFDDEIQELREQAGIDGPPEPDFEPED